MAQPFSSPGETDSRRPSARVVAVLLPDGQSNRTSHEVVSWISTAKRIAALQGVDFAGVYDPSLAYDAPLYLVPGQTIVGTDRAKMLGIRSEQDFFGGVAPCAFVATKAISHPLVAADACAPEGWSPEMGRRVERAVLLGYTVFTAQDAQQAAKRLLDRGPVRAKPTCETGGRGQRVLRSLLDLNALLAELDPGELQQHGLVLEENLTEVATFSVGQVRVGTWVATYYGTQHLTPDNQGRSVYGGSSLLVVRGGYDALLALSLPDTARLAVAQARDYEAAALACFPGLFMSRSNYDVAQGIDAEGRRRSGVLEQSWRIGGASSAEIAALEAFAADPKLQVVRASTVELYGEQDALPAQATVHFCGHDATVGFLTKYTMVEPYGNL